MKIESLNVGDIVKSHDFRGIDDCYIVGEVLEVDRHTAMFKARVMERIFEGKQVECGPSFWAPLQGAFFADFEGWNRIEVLNTGEHA